MMINIIIPMCRKNLYEISNHFISPKILTQINNQTLLEYSQEIFKSLRENIKKIYIIPENKLKELNLKTIIKRISNTTNIVIPLYGNTNGIVCSCLMGIDELNLESELIISVPNHFIRGNLQDIIEYFRSQQADSGVLSFETKHPQYSFVKLNSDKCVIEVSEKKIISKHAIIKLVYFQKAKNFINAAQNVIRKDNSIKGIFYLSSCLNELILQQKKIIIYSLDNIFYYNFNDTNSIKSFSMSYKT